MTNTTDFQLDRNEVLPQLIQEPDKFLIIAGLAGTTRDIAHLCGVGSSNYYAMAGAMGGAVSIGLGLALAQPERRILVCTGDGELLMNIGALATVSVMKPANLGILCVDNGHYGETGNQQSHTGQCTNLATMAHGAGIPKVFSVSKEEDITVARKIIDESIKAFFVHLKVNDGPPAKIKRSLDAQLTKSSFRKNLFGNP